MRAPGTVVPGLSGARVAVARQPGPGRRGRVAAQPAHVLRRCMSLLWFVASSGEAGAAVVPGVGRVPPDA